jgi:hypothetical protein
MALGAVLVDRARILDKRAAASRVEGTTPMVQVELPWFRARLFLPGTRESDGHDGSYKRAVPGPQLMYGLRDSEGDAIELAFDMKVEVDSVQLGRAVWRVTGDPERMRKKRSVIGHLATLERVLEREFDPVDV